MSKRPEELDGFSVEEIIAEIKGMADGQGSPAVVAPEKPREPEKPQASETAQSPPEPRQEDIVDAIAREVREVRAAPTQSRPAPPPPPDEEEHPEPVTFKLRRPAGPARPVEPDAAPPPLPTPTVATPPGASSPGRQPRREDRPEAPLPEIIEELPPHPVPFGRRVAPSEPTAAQKILEEEARRAESERRAGQAPWRTRRQPAPQPEPEPQTVAEEDTQEFEITLEPPDRDTGILEPPAEDVPEEGRGLQYDFINLVYSDAQTAVRQLDKRIAAMSVRVLLLLPLLLAATYMTLCLPRGWPMPFGFTYISHPFLYLLALALLHCVAMVLAGEVTAAGLMRLLRLRPTLDSLVLFSQLCILAHTVSIILVPRWGGYLPYTCVGVLNCLIALLAKRQRAECLRRTYKASLMGTVPAAVKLVEEGGVPTAVKAETGAWVEMESIARPDPTERLGEVVAPIAMAAIVGLAVAASFGLEAGSRFLWCLAAIASAGAPLSLALSASLPARQLSKKLLTSGSGLINARRTRRLAACEAVVLRDGDIFPMGSVEISGMKIAQSYKMEAVLGCATAMMQEVGGGLARAFSEFARQQYVSPVRAENLRFFESGGLSAQVGPHMALLGSASFLMRMGVRVSEGVKLPSSLFLAIDGGFAGIFSIKYGVQSQAYAAFRMLRAGRITPILATRDVNITQAYVESRFELRAASTEYPDMNERIRLSEANLGDEADTLAFLSRDGMLPFSETLLAAKRQRRATRFGQTVGLAALVAGLLLMYFLAYNFKVTSAAPHNVLLYLLLWLVPTWLGSAMATRI